MNCLPLCAIKYKAPLLNATALFLEVYKRYYNTLVVSVPSED